MPDLDLGRAYAEHRPLIFGYLKRRLPSTDPAEIDDLTEAVFERACRFSGRYREDGYGPKRWLYAIARNVLADHFRHLHPTVALDAVTGVGQLRIGTDAHADALDLRAQIQTLPRLQRRAIQLRFILGLKVRVAAALMGRSEQATRKLSHRGLANLRRLRREVAAVAGT